MFGSQHNGFNMLSLFFDTKYIRIPIYYIGIYYICILYFTETELKIKYSNSFFKFVKIEYKINYNLRKIPFEVTSDKWIGIFKTK